MSVQVGIIGLPNAGKSTLFNALIKRSLPKYRKYAAVGKHPFTTVEPNRGAVDVPDKALDNLYEMFVKRKSRESNRTDAVSLPKKTYVQLRLVDIAGLIKGSYKGEGLGNLFLHHIREVDLVLHLVREFEDKTVAHIHEEIDPENDLEIVRTELILKDLETIEKQLEDRKSGFIGKMGKTALDLLKRIKEGLNKGRVVREMDLTDEERKIIKPLFLLTAKPEIVVRNCGEKEKITGEEYKAEGFLRVCAKLENELSDLPYVEQRQYIKEFGLPEPALEKIIRYAYKSLELITFYTIAGGKEVRAWTLPRRSTVYEAAGKIHTDMQKGFIKAEVIKAADLIKIGSWQEAKSQGKVQLMGRDYIVEEKDVVEIKFN